MSGPAGPTGHRGIVGRKGLQGTPYGAPGTTFYSTTGTVPVTIMTSGGPPGGSVTYLNAGGVYNVQGTGNTAPNINFPTNLSTDQYGTFWTITNTTGQADQLITIQAGVYKLTLPEAVLTRSDGQEIALFIYPAQSVTFVFVAGSNTTAEFIAF